MSARPVHPLAGLKRLGREIERAASAIGRVTLLLPKEAAMMTRIPEHELGATFTPVLIKEWPVRRAGKTIMRRRLGFRLSDLEKHIERRELR